MVRKRFKLDSSRNINQSDQTLDACVICGGESFDVLFESQGSPIVECKACGLFLRKPRPTRDALAQIHASARPDGTGLRDINVRTDRLKRATASLYLDQIEQFRRWHEAAKEDAELIEIGCGMGNLLAEARDRGYRVTGVDLSEAAVSAANERLGEGCVQLGRLEDITLPKGEFDVCVLADVIQQARNPAEFMDRVYRLLKPGGVLFMTLPSTDSWTARWMKRHWYEIKPENLYYFDRETIWNLLVATGFGQIDIRPGRKKMSMAYMHHQLKRYRRKILAPLLSLTHLLPFLRHRAITMAPSGINILGRRETVEPPTQRRAKLSVVMPVYNEKATFQEVMDALLAKEIDGIDIEIVIIESNSTDGSRELVAAYGDHPRVQIILEDRPQGKGHAVRAGLERVSGDFILIQDADLEYDLDDYEVLLEPLRHYRKAFVLGSRYIERKSWKMRHFEDQYYLSVLLNLGHVFFTLFFNVLYGQRLRDPFTMYKVFQRECMSTLTFECNRFDFDCELVAKLVRRGYTPIEIPVTYNSRSFNEGKKVSFFKDPPTYFRAFIKYRLINLDRKA